MNGPEFTHVPGDPVPLEVAALESPDGKVRVLLQMPTGFLLIDPPSARRLAGMLLDAADAAEDT